jgi:hypothetical protein
LIDAMMNEKRIRRTVYFHSGHYDVVQSDGSIAKFTDGMFTVLNSRVIFGLNETIEDLILNEKMSNALKILAKNIPNFEVVAIYKEDHRLIVTEIVIKVAYEKKEELPLWAMNYLRIARVDLYEVIQKNIK